MAGGSFGGARGVRNHRARGVTADGQPIFSEAIEQQWLCQWLDEKGIFYCHVPNGEVRDWATARKLKRMGVKPGIPDILIFDPPPRLPHIATAIEMKAIDGKPPTKDQAEILALLAKRNWYPCVAYGHREAIDYLEAAGYGKNRVKRP